MRFNQIRKVQNADKISFVLFNVIICEEHIALMNQTCF